jgi:hypothetical protein
MEFRALKACEVDVRVAQVTQKGVSLLLYKDARCDMNILDETVGALNWQRQHLRDNQNCIVSIWDSNKEQWISKEDTGTESNTEKEKGLASDSFKRACFNWGIGRELYTAPFIWVSAEQASIYDTGRKDKAGKPVYGCKDSFTCSMLEVSEGKITALGIKNRNGEVVFAWGKKTAPKCEKCGKEIASAKGKSGKEYTANEVAEMSRKKYGKVLCGDCV